MAFRDLDEFLVVEPVVLPIRGRDYAFPGSVSARVWLQLQSMSEQMQAASRAAAAGEEFDPDNEVLSDIDEAAMMSEMLGGVQDEMVAAGLSSAHIRAAFYTLIAWHLSGEEAAEAVWNAQGNGGKAAAPNRAARRKKSPPASSRASSNAVPKSAAQLPPGEASSETGS